MKYSSLKVILAISTVTFLASCTREGCTDPAATNYADNADTDNGTCEYDVEAPATYEFTDASGNSTVSYTGQRQRLNMLCNISRAQNSVGKAP